MFDVKNSKFSSENVITDMKNSICYCQGYERRNPGVDSSLPILMSRSCQPKKEKLLLGGEDRDRI